MNIDNRDVNAQLRIQSTILEMIALRADLDEILARQCILVQELIPSSVASLMLIDKSTGRLNVRSAPGIPEGTRNCFNGLAMSPNSGSCGTAAYTGKMVMVENTLTDPRWEGLRDLARKIGKLSCWSVPVFYAEEVVGTFAISRSAQGAPGENELALLATAGNLVGIVITADRADSELCDQRSLLQSVVDSAEDPIPGLALSTRQTGQGAGLPDDSREDVRTHGRRSGPGSRGQRDRRFGSPGLGHRRGPALRANARGSGSRRENAADPQEPASRR